MVIYLGNKLSKSHKDKKPGFNEGIFIESQQVRGEADPGVISEGESEDDFTASIKNVF